MGVKIKLNGIRTWKVEPRCIDVVLNSRRKKNSSDTEGKGETGRPKGTQLRSKISSLCVWRLYSHLYANLSRSRAEKTAQPVYERIKIQDFSQAPCRNSELRETMKREIMLKSESRGYGVRGLDRGVGEVYSDKSYLAYRFSRWKFTISRVPRRSSARKTI